MPKPQEVQELREKLLHNIQEIRKVIPDFQMTEEQIDHMLSEERIAVRDRAKEFMEHHAPLNNNDEILQKYMPVNNLPKAYKRNYYFVIKKDGSPESEAFNKTMFEGLDRDDEVGDIKRTNYCLYCMNAAKNLDRHILKPESTEAEMLDYYIRNEDAINIGAEMPYFLRDTNELHPTKEARESTLIGEEIGGGFLGYPEYAASEFFLTFPFGYLSPDQKKKVNDQFYHNADKYDIAGGTRELVVMFNKDGNSSQMRSRPKLLNVDPESVPSADLTMADIEYDVPQEKRFLGGYSARIELMKENLPEILRITEAGGDEHLAKIHEAAESANQLLNQIHEIPTVEEQQEIISRFDRLGYRISRLKQAGDEKLSSVADSLKTLAEPAGPLHKKESLESLVHYEEQDRNAAAPERSDRYRQIDEHLKAMNDTVALLDSTGEGITQRDINELRAQTAEVLRMSEDFLERDPAEVGKAYRENVRHIRDRMQRQQRNLGRATAGLKASGAVSGYTRELDITGHEFSTARNTMSTRIAMTITGNDGKPVNGYFTERITLNPEKGCNIMHQKLLEQWPDQGELIDETIAFYMTIPSNREIDEHRAKLMQDHPGREEDMKALDENAEELCNRFSTTKAQYELSLGSTDQADVETRNIAMSDVADLFGKSSLLARSTPMTVYKDGKKMEGCFMEAAEGDDLDRVPQGKASHFLQAGLDFLDNSPALKQIADIQVIDYICGNIDRHAGNLIYQFSKDGKKVQNVVGIDNDYSFPERRDEDLTGAKPIAPEDMCVISESMAEKINSITPSMLRCTLSGNHLTENEITRAVEKLQIMQNLIRDPNRPFKIVPDQEIAGYKLDELRTYGNMFDRIKKKFLRDVDKLSDEEKKDLLSKKRPKDAGTETVDLFRKADKTSVMQDAGPVDESVQQLQAARRHVIGGSTEYDDVQTAMENLQTAMRILEDPNRTVDEKLLKNFRKAYNTAEKKCVAYLNRKKRQKKLDAGGKTGRRIEAVRKALKFCKNRQASLTVQLGDDPLQIQDADTRREIDQANAGMFWENPNLAGDILRAAVKAADEKQDDAEVQRKAVRQIGNVVRFMKKEGLHPRALGISKEDQHRAAEVVQRSKELDAAQKKAEASAPVIF